MHRPPLLQDGRVVVQLRVRLEGFGPDAVGTCTSQGSRKRKHLLVKPSASRKVRLLGLLMLKAFFFPRPPGSCLKAVCDSHDSSLDSRRLKTSCPRAGQFGFVKDPGKIPWWKCAENVRRQIIHIFPCSMKTTLNMTQRQRSLVDEPP